MLRSIPRARPVATFVALASTGLASHALACGPVTTQFTGPHDGSLALGGTNEEAGQTFTASTGGALCSVELFLQRNGITPVQMTVSIMGVDGQGLPTGPALASASIAATLPDSFAWFTFDFSALGFSLTGGEQYALITKSVPGDGGYVLGTASGHPYLGGRGVVKLGPTETWQFMGETSIGERDVLFSIRVAEELGACGGDLTGDQIVDGADLGALLKAWGGAGVEDLNQDGIVDGVDLAALLAAWGECG